VAGGSLAGPTGLVRDGASVGGIGPVFGGAGVRDGREDRDRQQRNTVFVPSAEPFHVEFDDVAPPVLGLCLDDQSLDDQSLEDGSHSDESRPDERPEGRAQERP
jgi:hypothetical protein